MLCSVFAIIFFDKYISFFQNFCFSENILFILESQEFPNNCSWLISPFSPHSMCTLSLHSLCPTFSSTLDGPLFHIVPSFLYCLPLLRQSLCYFVSNDPLVQPVSCGYFLWPICGRSCMLDLRQLS